MPAQCAVATVHSLPIKLQKRTIACCEFTILTMAQLGGICYPTNSAHDRKLRSRNGLFNRPTVRSTHVMQSDAISVM